MNALVAEIADVGYGHYFFLVIFCDWDNWIPSFTSNSLCGISCHWNKSGSCVSSNCRNEQQRRKSECNWVFVKAKHQPGWQRKANIFSQVTFNKLKKYFKLDALGNHPVQSYLPLDESYSVAATGHPINLTFILISRSNSCRATIVTFFNSGESNRHTSSPHSFSKPLNIDQKGAKQENKSEAISPEQRV